MRRLGTLAVSFALLISAPASAAEINVTGTADPGACTGDTPCTGIRAALVVANRLPGPDTIVVRDGTHQLLANAGGPLVISSEVTIRGAGARLTSVVGSGTGRVFEVQGVQATIQSLSMQSGQATGSLGGNLQNLGGNVVLDHVRVTGGGATGGGGVANDTGTMTIQSSLIDANNVATVNGNGDGGGILNISGANAQAVLTVRDSTVTGNAAVAPGGGIASVSRSGQPTITTLEHVTLARNRTTSGVGGLAFDGTGSFTVRDSIIDDNTSGSAAVIEWNCGSASIASGGRNVAGVEPVGVPQCAFAAGGDLAGADALLSTLENQGGQTDVLRLLPGSPAINRAGVCGGADQRDLLRPQGGVCDSGAFEVDQPPDTTLVANPPTFTFSSTEPGVRFECRLDRPRRTGTPFACSSPASFPNLPVGSYTFVVRAIDGSGQGDPTAATAAFVVQAPKPDAGKSVVVNKVRGRVLVKVPGGKFVSLNQLREIPDGSIIDTRDGVVALVFEPKPGRKTQKAKFWDGLFKLDQKGTTMELSLVEKLARCAQAGDATSAARKKKRRLWGDGKGRFRTKGQYSSATVRGTRWLVNDSCDGTLTVVRKGKVSVRDFVRKRTIRLKKGQQYLARP